MKLPEFDSRPSPGEPLYRDINKDEREAKGALKVWLLIVCGVAILFGLGSIADLLVSLLRASLH